MKKCVTLLLPLSCLSTSNLFHTAFRPSFHPLDRTLPVESWVALTVDGEVGVGAVHDKNNMEVVQDS